MIRQARSVLKGELALVIGQLRNIISKCHRTISCSFLTIEFVNVAGIAISIHQTMPIKKSLPLPLTKLDTSWPSIAATFKLIRVLTTRKMLWLINNRNSVLFHPGMHILSSRKRFRKNSLFNSTFCLLVASPWPGVVEPRCLEASWRAAAAFCSEIAERMR